MRLMRKWGQLMAGGSVAACALFCATFMVAVAGLCASADTAAFNRQFQAAVACYQREEYGQARHLLAALLKQVPDSFELNELMGLIYAAQREPAAAAGFLAKAVRLKPTSAEARMYWAATLTALNQNSHAETEFKTAVQLEPASYDANHNLGEFYVAAGNLPAAIPYLQKAQEINPSSYNNGYDLALAEIRTGNSSGAKTTLDRLLGYHNAADLHSLLAMADERTGRFVDAANEYELAARMSPTPQNIFAWGSELLLHHTLEPAVEVFQRGVEIYPRSAELQVGLGIALYSRTHYAEAIEAFCRAIDLNPNDPRPYGFLGKIYDVSPLQARSVTERFARFVQLQSHNPRALYYYALSLWKASRTEMKTADFSRVEALLKSAATLDPHFAEAHLQLGIFYFERHRYDDAIVQYRQTIRTQPDLADAYYHLGEALVRTGRRAEAQQEFQAFARLHASQVQAREKERQKIMQFVYTAKKQ